ncbi:Uncharacterised protein [Bordetella pertussis]|nr:Uncharacterised protein [Bordetella pertussis]CFV95373.1 Uncharacterised protein [Bordetella pertussis]
MDAYLISAGVTPAWANAAGAERAAPVTSRSSWWPPLLVRMVSPWPTTLMRGRFRLRATSGATITNAPPPSVMTQQSSRCSGSATIGEPSTSSTV